MIMAVYLAISLSISLLMNLYNRSVRAGGADSGMTDTTSPTRSRWRRSARRSSRPGVIGWLRANLFNSGLQHDPDYHRGLSPRDHRPADDPLGVDRRGLECAERAGPAAEPAPAGRSSARSGASSCSAGIRMPSNGVRRWSSCCSSAMILASCDRRMWGRRLFAAMAGRPGPDRHS